MRAHLSGKMQALIAVCLIVIIGSMSYKLVQAKKNDGLCTLAINNQQTAINELVAENIKLKNTAPTSASCPAPTTAAPTAQTAVQSVLDPQDSDAQAKIDTLKKRYEDILVTYFVLRKCNKNNPLDYHIIISALSQEMASDGAPGRLQYDITTSAQGSYKEMYSANKCDAATIDPLLGQYKNFINGIGKEFLPK